MSLAFHMLCWHALGRKELPMSSLPKRIVLLCGLLLIALSIASGCSPYSGAGELDAFDIIDHRGDAWNADRMANDDGPPVEATSEEILDVLWPDEVTDVVFDDELAADLLDLGDAGSDWDAFDELDVCVSACENKECGDDGCGGSCGQCASGQDDCVAGQCVCVPVCPACNTDDGCGSFCLCQEGFACILGECKDCFDGPLEFPDPALAQRVAEWYGTEVGGTTMADVAGETYLPVIDRGVLLLDGLGCLTELVTLYLDGNDFDDLSPLAGMPLHSLSIMDTPVASLAPLVFVPTLEQFFGLGTQVSTLASLKDHQLTILNVMSASLTDLIGLEDQSELVKAWLSDNQLTDISPLEGCSSLLELDLKINEISDITPLAGLTKLTELSIHKNQVTDITALAGLAKLEWLALGANEITSFEPLAALSSLKVLDLSGNHNPDIGVVSGLPNLSSLSLLFCDLESLPDLSEIQSLELLEFGGNDVSNLSPLTPLESLDEIWADDNLITDLTPLVDNPGIGEGDYVNVLWNPIDCVDQAANIAELEARGVELDIQCPCQVCLD
jgi:Leucine-rich repeat (LRR) protein